eukprot:g2393.t1
MNSPNAFIGKNLELLVFAAVILNEEYLDQIFLRNDIEEIKYTLVARKVHSCRNSGRFTPKLNKPASFQ